MPNWCENTLIVRSLDPKRLVEFDEAFKGKVTKWGLAEYQKYNKTEEQIAQMQLDYEKAYEEAEPTYSFDALYPVPQEVIDVGFSGNRQGVSLERSLAALRDKEKWIDGYTWCVSHWGTKWDLSSDSVGVSKDENEYTYNFSTAWSPPVDWVEKVAKDWAELEFTIKFEEGGCAFAGLVTFAGGEQVDEVSIDSDGYREFVIEHFKYDPYEGYEDDIEEATAISLDATNSN